VVEVICRTAHGLSASSKVRFIPKRLLLGRRRRGLFHGCSKPRSSGILWLEPLTSFTVFVTQDRKVVSWRLRTDLILLWPHVHPVEHVVETADVDVFGQMMKELAVLVLCTSASQPEATQGTLEIMTG
jgi:hypothetical protein